MPPREIAIFDGLLPQRCKSRRPSCRAEGGPDHLRHRGPERFDDAAARFRAGEGGAFFRQRAAIDAGRIAPAIRQAAIENPFEVGGQSMTRQALEPAAPRRRGTRPRAAPGFRDVTGWTYTVVAAWPLTGSPSRTPMSAEGALPSWFVTLVTIPLRTRP